MTFNARRTNTLGKGTSYYVFASEPPGLDTKPNRQDRDKPGHKVPKFTQSTVPRNPKNAG